MPARTGWSIAASIATLLIPGFLLSAFGVDTPVKQRAWREKVLLFQLFLVASGAFGGAILFGQRYFCAQPLMFTTDAVPFIPNLFIANGRVVDIARLANTTAVSIVSPYMGQDLSAIFPMFAQLGRSNATGTYNYTDPDITKCVGSRINSAERWLSTRLNDTGYRRSDPGKLASCPLPNGQTTSTCFVNPGDRSDLAQATIADLGWSRAAVAKRQDISNSNAMVIVRNHVYDLGRFLNIATDTGRSVRSDYNFFSDATTQALGSAVGGDATAALAALSDVEDTIKCLDKLFYAGTVQDTFYQGCGLFNPVWYGLTALILLPILLKIVAGHVGSLVASCLCCTAPLSSEANVLLVVSCYAEPEDQLAKCLEAAACTEYTDTRKLLCVVCDGNVLLENSNIEAHQAVLDILGYRGNEPRPRAYESVGEGARAYNEAKVYSGTYQTPDGRHQVEYVVIAKMGTKYELERSGNRGKRDTHAMLLRFLERVRHVDSALSPLEYELQHRFHSVLGYDPRSFEYALMLDASTRLSKDAVTALVRQMDAENAVAVLLGEARHSNTMHGPVTVLQAYPEYVRRQLGMHFEGWTGLLGAHLPHDTFAMHRLKYYDGSPCLLNRELIDDYAGGCLGTKNALAVKMAEESGQGMSSSPPPTMHMLNALYMGETALFGQVARRHLGSQMAAVATSSAARATSTLPTGVASTWAIQCRQWNARFHGKWEAVRSRGAVSLWARFWLLWEVVGMLMLPAATLCLYYAIYTHVTSVYLLSSALVAYSFLALALLNAALLLLSGRISFLLMLTPLFLLVGVPIFYVLVPVCAFWNSDSVKWAPKHRAALDTGTVHVHGCHDSGEGENRLGRMHVPLHTLAEWSAADGTDVKPQQQQQRGPAALVGKPQFAQQDFRDSQAPSEGEYDDWQHQQQQDYREADGVQMTAPYMDSFQRGGAQELPHYAAMDPLADTLPPPPLAKYSNQNDSFDDVPTPPQQHRQPQQHLLHQQSYLRPYSMAPTETELNLESGHLSRPESMVSIDARRSVLPQPLVAVKNNNTNNTGNGNGNNRMAQQTSRQQPLPAYGASMEMRPTNFSEQRRPVPRKSPLRSDYGESEADDQAAAQYYGDAVNANAQAEQSQQQQQQRNSFSPMRAQSMARSDYVSEYTPDFNDGMSRRSVATVGSMYGNLDDDALVELAGGLTKDEIRAEIRFLLQDADLNTITRREVKEHLFVQFGAAVDFYHDYINICIEEYTLEKLALL